MISVHMDSYAKYPCEWKSWNLSSIVQESSHQYDMRPDSLQFFSQQNYNMKCVGQQLYGPGFEIELDMYNKDDVFKCFWKWQRRLVILVQAGQPTCSGMTSIMIHVIKPNLAIDFVVVGNM